MKDAPTALKSKADRPSKKPLGKQCSISTEILRQDCRKTLASTSFTQPKQAGRTPDYLLCKKFNP